MSKTAKRSDAPLQRSLTAKSGRGRNGKFVKGNRCARGNPIAIRIQEYRDGLAKGATPDDLRQIIARLVRQAKRPDVAAARVVFERLVGPPVAFDIEERLAKLEELLREESEQ